MAEHRPCCSGASSECRADKVGETERAGAYKHRRARQAKRDGSDKRERREMKIAIELKSSLAARARSKYAHGLQSNGRSMQLVREGAVSRADKEQRCSKDRAKKASRGRPSGASAASEQVEARREVCGAGRAGESVDERRMRDALGVDVDGARRPRRRGALERSSSSASGLDGLDWRGAA